MGELVRYAASGGVARLTLDSPHNRNALSSQLQTELHDHLHEALDDEDVRVIVLTGEGPAFCSGADLKEQRDGESTVGPEFLPKILKTIWHSPKPVLGRIQGHARAGGLGLVGACDIVVATDEATFGFPEVRLGLLPAMIAVTVVPRLSPRASLELFLTGETFDAARAAEIGLVNVAVADSRLDEEVERYADMLLQGGPEALGMVKPMIGRVRELPMDEAFDEMLELSITRFLSEEGQEGMRAFGEKRAPSWRPEA